VGLLSDGLAKTQDEIQAHLQLDNPAHPAMANAMMMLKECGILVRMRPGYFLLTSFYWFAGTDNPYHQAQLVCPTAPTVNYQWQCMNIDTYRALTNAHEVRDVTMPVPQNQECLAHQHLMGQRIVELGAKYQKAHLILRYLKTGDKSADDLLQYLGYSSRGCHYVSKPLKELKAAGIVVYDTHTHTNKLTPFFWFAA